MSPVCLTTKEASAGNGIPGFATAASPPVRPQQSSSTRRVLKFFESPRNRLYEHFRNSTLAPSPDYPDHVPSPRGCARGRPHRGKVAVCLHEATKIMSNKIGRFEILSELAHSDFGAVYKATDSESNQTVALKTLKLETLGEQAAALVKGLLEEAEAARFSTATTLPCSTAPRKWTAISAPRLNTCRATASPPCWRAKKASRFGTSRTLPAKPARAWTMPTPQNVFHYTLEPAKIMVHGTAR